MVTVEGNAIRAENGRVLDGFPSVIRVTAHAAGESAVSFIRDGHDVVDIYRDRDGILLTTLVQYGGPPVALSAGRRELVSDGIAVELPGQIESGVQLGDVVVVAVDEGRYATRNVYGVDVRDGRIVWRVAAFEHMPPYPAGVPYGPIYRDASHRLIAANSSFSLVLDPTDGRILDWFESH
jgi:hypothetical protein